MPDYDPNREFMCVALTSFGIGQEGIAPNCVGKTVEANKEGLELFTGELMSAITFLLTASVQMVGSEMNINQLRALNALRCAVTSLGDNT